jgi:glycerol-3-phosphate dehydrogenase (NAD(P)+)
LVAKAMQGMESVPSKTLRAAVEQEVESTKSFFRTRYHREAPFHPVITSDLPEAIERGVKTLVGRGALRVSPLRRRYSAKNPSLLRFYAYHADRRIYPLRGRNTMTVINAGAWGYTLALHIGMNLLKKEELSEHSVILYDSREDLIEKLTVEGKHPWHFKDIALPRSVRPEADLIAAVGDTSLILMVTPSKYFHSTLVKVLGLAPDGSDLVIATKGFIPETGLLPCQTAHLEMERLGKKMRVSVLSGANLAHEIILGGAGVTQIACEHYETFERLRPLIETRLFRVVYSGDVIGTTISAALKNVYAIGFGILEGSKKAPENFLATYATLVTAEIRNFGVLLGAALETFDAESQVWMADLLATCRGGRSAKFGRDLAEMDEKHSKSRPARILLETYRKKRIAVEGFEASRFAQRIAAQRGFHPAILGEIYSILHGGKQINVEEFMEKCLDALSHRVSHPVPSTLRSRSQGY